MRRQPGPRWREKTSRAGEAAQGFALRIMRDIGVLFVDWTSLRNRGERGSTVWRRGDMKVFLADLSNRDLPHETRTTLLIIMEAYQLLAHRATGLSSLFPDKWLLEGGGPRD